MDMSDPTETADVIVVGGGSAGAVLSARLSASTPAEPEKGDLT
jgi:choline dehydrogenase-like flavoprotein